MEFSKKYETFVTNVFRIGSSSNSKNIETVDGEYLKISCQALSDEVYVAKG